ncbi:MAG: FHA domain-containing protein [Lachnospiraceae bacterium]
MDIRKCEKGHFYDANKNKTCPQCMQERTGRMTGFDIGNPNNINTRAKAMNAQYEKVHVNSKRKNYGAGTSFETDENRTVGFYSMKMKIEPVVGWLVCIKGEDEGTSFPLKLGRNFIGRGANMDVVLKNDQSVSRKKHAIVLYEPRTKSFIAQPGESRELVYLNDEIVLVSERLKPYDILAVGNSELAFVPFCGPKFSWEDWDEE